MKTVLICDQLGQDAIKFLVVEGDYRHLQGKYANSIETTDSERDEAIALIKLLAFSSRDKEQGKLISGTTLLSRLAQRCHRFQEENDDNI